MIDFTKPFLLLDDPCPADPGRALLYRDPVGIVSTRDPDEVRSCLAALADSLSAGRHAAGFLSYEAGHSLEDRFAPLRARPSEAAPPLLWFGLFEGCSEISGDRVATLLPGAAGVSVAPPLPLIDPADYAAVFEQVKRHIAAGDIYQLNLTFPAEVHFQGTPAALFGALRKRARAGHGGLAFTGSHWLLSLSPELFFTLKEGRLTARPMKGTAPRSSDPDEDARLAEALQTDVKERAENLMIVDLLRNDLSRVSRPGSVTVETLYAIETYPTVHQMTSTVTGRIEPGRGPIDVLAALFPCGSITGAPKIRAMEIIDRLEAGPRGVYTGSIGRLAPDGEAAFNVAIRTITVNVGSQSGRLGLGSGVVADGRADEEWRECLAKGAFVSDGTNSFDLVETMMFDPHDGIANLERHLQRMKASAEVFGFQFDRHDTRNELQAATFRLRDARKLRLILSRTGTIAIECRALPNMPDEPVEVALAPLPCPPEDFRLRHKTSDRSLYDEARWDSGCFEVLFIDDDGYLTQGSFTSLFVQRDGMLLTPPLSRALLPGVLRDQLIANGHAKEADLRPEDLSGGFSIGNAVRGLIAARLKD